METQCPCGTILAIDPSMAGTAVQCPSCGQQFVLPAVVNPVPSPPVKNAPLPVAQTVVAPPAPSQQDSKKGFLKAAIGLGLVVALVAIVLLGIRFWNKTQDPAYAFIQDGYKKVSKPIVVESATVNEKRVYETSMATFNGPITTDIAVFGNMCDFKSNVDGDIDFTGNVLNIGENCIVKGDINAPSANVINVHGRVEGEIYGNVNFTNRNTTAENREGIRWTRQLIAQLLESVKGSSQTQNRLLNDDQGKNLIGSSIDFWGNKVRYERNQINRFTVRSAGPDGKFDNQDDVIETGTFVASLAESMMKQDESPDSQSSEEVVIPIAQQPAVEVPKDIDEAIRFLKSHGDLRQNSGFDWLAETDLEPTEDQRTKIVRTSLPFIYESSKSEKAIKLIKRWIDDETRDLMVNAATITDDRKTAMKLLVLFENIDHNRGVIALINHPSEFVRDRAEKTALRQLSDQRVLVDQSIADLKNPTRVSLACKRLTTHHDPSDLARVRLVKAINTVKLDSEFVMPRTRDVLDLISAFNVTNFENISDITERVNDYSESHRLDQLREKLGPALLDMIQAKGISYEHVPFLLSLIDQKDKWGRSNRELRKKVLDYLVELRDPRAIPYVIEELDDQGHISSFDDDLDRIASFGPVAEQALLARVDDRRTEDFVFRALEVVGTTQTIRLFESKIKNNERLSDKYEFEKVISFVRDSRRQPAGLSAGAYPNFITRHAMDLSEAAIIELARQTGVAPEQESADVAELLLKDAWARPLKYVRESDDVFQLVSSGPDQRFDTADDIVEAAPTQAAADATMVATFLGSPDRSQHRRAIQWLEENDQIEEELRTPILAGLVLLCNDIEAYESAAKCLIKHARVSDGQMIYNALVNHQKLPLRVEPFEATLQDVMSKIGYHEGAVALVGNSNPRVSRQAIDAIQNSGIADQRAAQVLLTAVKTGTPNKKSEILKQLALLDLTGVDKSELRKAIGPLMSVGQTSLGESAFQVLNKLGLDASDADFMAQAYLENSRLDKVLAPVFKKIASPELVAKHIQLMISSNGSRVDRVGDIISWMGSVGEEQVIELLSHESWVVYYQAAEILGRIGTSKSLGPLQELIKREPSRKARFQTAIDSITERNGLEKLGDPIR